MQLHIEAVHQAQWFEFILAQFTRKAAVYLIPELVGALIDDPLIDGVILIHRQAARSRRAVAGEMVAGEVVADEIVANPAAA